MATVMSANEFVEKLEDIAKNYKTLYVMGCIGAPMTAANKKKYIAHHTYNQKEARVKMINAASTDTFGFDCVCLIKSVLWGWNGNKKASYGGAKYNPKLVPDINADAMIEKCYDVTTDFSKIKVGEALWTNGHIGVYIGNGLAVECTPAWKNKVQITAVNVAKPGYNTRKWKKHGKLPYIEYANTTEVKSEEVCNVDVKVLKKGSKGDSVKALQTLLIGYGHSCGSKGVDGDFGPSTDKAVRAYQKAKGLEVDGSVGPATWGKLLGVS